jgi:hypothetical protein
MTIELRQQGQPAPQGTVRDDTGGQQPAIPLTYKGVDIRIQVQRTPDYVFGHADLVDGDRYCGRLSIGNPRATPDQVQQRLAALAQARVDILRCMQRGSGP